MIIQKRVKFEPLIQLMTPEGRVYQTPEGTFQSVTTKLKNALNDGGLKAWRKSVGEEKADQISEKAKNRGNSVHKIFENYFNEKSIRGSSPVNLELFLKVKPFLEKSKITLFGVELPLYSANLKTAGTADFVACWNEKYYCIGDIKTVNRPLKEDDVRWLSYHLQTTVYGMMFEELYGIKMPYNMIIVLDQEGPPNIDITSSEPYRQQVREIFQ